jgi:hypothetical protein
MRRVVIVDASIVRPPTVSFAQLFTAPGAPSDESSAMWIRFPCPRRGVGVYQPDRQLQCAAAGSARMATNEPIDGERDVLSDDRVGRSLRWP